MANYTKAEYKQFRSDLSGEIITHINANPGLKCRAIEEAMVALHPEWVEKFGMISSVGSGVLLSNESSTFFRPSGRRDLWHIFTKHIT